MKRLWIVALVMVLALALAACSGEPVAEEPKTIFQGSGDYWSVQIDDQVTRKNGKDYFAIRYTYQGSLDDLKAIDEIVFAQGTALGNQVVNWYDPGYKETLVKQGQYQEEYETSYGIVVEPIKERRTPEFLAYYDVVRDGNDYTNLDAIEKDRILIQIKWKGDGLEQTESIQTSWSSSDHLRSASAAAAKF